jgi:hypothetical protein
MHKRKRQPIDDLIDAYVWLARQGKRKRLGRAKKHVDSIDDCDGHSLLKWRTHSRGTGTMPGTNHFGRMQYNVARGLREIVAPNHVESAMEWGS